ncbi:MAG TPA: bifunctional phosphopantothenoylcysteine decarboxylase/phosphopantothenate--cysteine ligase CoaBC [Candidatus Sumerlaeota bacterium]|nr:MAG: Coenzyme A biosynthesis bifunctional protein CoaBC [candidate division BRC1 bacterium ADurb.Bin183]HOE63519.1 bifunctional phosphopantothenoylcysteine decarboxylase/phosphopantothenate--cysteine ligase CoaBC [Candidatus Sumerlaeota bacterium]HRR31510.1 bifunctional phosphopantothenoylcysteine decarboxylase/phosphopantothenate--cysteine ligase CoaBC [Candidatus Sumerlaeia bacterium]HON51366.1 bifunctional phosphopantothenoylcysteine decarboxylase/phosphopantothenate--cysteine ligase CoaBC
MIKGKKILLGVSSSVACYKAVELARLFCKAGCEVRVVMTPNAANLVQPLQFEAATRQPVYCDVFNRRAPWDVEHISLAHWGDIFVIAPATANIMAKMAGGIADDAPTTLYLAFAKPVFIAPAMHTEMWHHPATQSNLGILLKRGIHVIGPASGDLASGDKGLGRMAEPQKIFEFVVKFFKPSQSLGDKKVLITAGPTREMIDPIRFISNRSSGKMGYALAEEAAQRGADVTLISGHTNLPAPANVKIIRITSAIEMHQEVLKLAHQTEIFIFAAAVGDYRPAKTANTKIKKQSDEITLNLVRNPDIAKEIGKNAKQNQTLIGFAAETGNLEEYARKKLKEKNFDMIIANDVSSKEIGMGCDENKVSFIYAKGKMETAGPALKRDLAVVVWDKIEKIITTKKER